MAALTPSCAFDLDTGIEFKMAMGPVSTALKPGGTAAAADQIGVTCLQFERSCAKSKPSLKRRLKILTARVK
jgi:hypothetical protein